MSDNPKQKRDFPLLSGLARGLTADIVGGPVDLATILVNSGLAAYGYAGNKLGRLKPSEMPDLIENPVGGSDWFAGKNTPLTDDGSARFTTGRLTGNLLPSLPSAAASLAPKTKLNQPNIFAGFGSDTVDTQMAAKASEMFSKGATPDEVFKATGFFKGKDGKLRYEISDDKFKFAKDPDPYKGVDSSLPLSAYQTKARQNRYGGLGDFVEHPELFAAYPELRNLPVEIWANHNYPGQPRGSFDRNTGAIEAVAKDPDELRKIVLHEIQHKVQQMEGFGRGGSPTTVTSELRETAKEHPAAKALNVQNLAQLYDLPYDKMLERYPRLQQHIVDYAAETSRAKLNDTLDRFLGIRDKRAFDLYKGLAGEAESRNVETRSLFTPEQRRETPPWQTLDVPFEQQYLLEAKNAGKSLLKGLAGK